MCTVESESPVKYATKTQNNTRNWQNVWKEKEVKGDRG